MRNETTLSPLRGRQAFGGPAPTGERAERGAGSVVGHEVGEDRKQLHYVSVPVEHRVAELGPYLT
jgi:hypothetical protein